MFVDSVRALHFCDDAVLVKLETQHPQLTNTQHVRAKCVLPLYVPPCHEFSAELGSALMSKLINNRQNYIGLEKNHLNTFISQGLA